MQFILKLFVKNYEDAKDPSVREACGKLGGLVGILSNIFLCIIKVATGLFASSIAIIADGINNLTDAAASFITVLGFKFASMPEDEKHPYGHARAEYLTGVFISVFIIIVGVQLLITSVNKVMHPTEASYNMLTIIILLVAIAIKIWQSYFNFRLGERISSITLIATAIDSRNDVIATSAVLLSIIVSKFTALQTDGWMGCAVALFIIWSGISLVKETSSSLLGEAPDDEIIGAITQKTMEAEGVLGVHDIMVHNYGHSKIFASMHVEVSAGEDIMGIHNMIDGIERTISEELNIKLVIHVDPIDVTNPKLKNLHKIVLDELHAIEGICGIHDFRIVEEPTHTNIIFDIELLPKCKVKEDEIKSLIDARLKRENENYFALIIFDKAYIKPKKVL